MGGTNKIANEELKFNCKLEDLVEGKRLNDNELIYSASSNGLKTLIQMKDPDQIHLINYSLIREGKNIEGVYSSHKVVEPSNENYNVYMAYLLKAGLWSKNEN